LKGTVRQELRKEGFGNDEIFEEYWTDDRKYRIDIVGKKRNEIIAYECGNTTIGKLNDLRMVFDKVIWIPYLFSRKSLGLRRKGSVHRKGYNLKKRYRKNISNGVLRIPSAVRREIFKTDNVILHENAHNMSGSMVIYPANSEKRKVIRSLQVIIRDLKQDVEDTEEVE